jgi:DNA-binding CsgD family transcriptional regulator
MKIRKRDCTIQQMAYAKRILGGQGDTKGQIALQSGYSPNVARSVKSHIENKMGFHNAMTKLAVESNNLALAAMHEFKARGFKGFTNKELIGSLNAIGNAWSKFNEIPKEKGPSQENNKLRTIVLQQIENQTNQTIALPDTTIQVPEERMDF